MTAKASISLTDAQERFARRLVADGRFPSLSAVLQHGLERLRAETEAEETELAALRALIEARRAGAFRPLADHTARTERLIAAERRARGL